MKESASCLAYLSVTLEKKLILSKTCRQIFCTSKCFLILRKSGFKFIQSLFKRQRHRIQQYIRIKTCGIYSLAKFLLESGKLTSMSSKGDCIIVLLEAPKSWGSRLTLAAELWEFLEKFPLPRLLPECEKLLFLKSKTYIEM